MFKGITHACTHAHTCMHARTHMHAHTHTHTHACTHMHTPRGGGVVWSLMQCTSRRDSDYHPNLFISSLLSLTTCGLFSLCTYSYLVFHIFHLRISTHAPFAHFPDFLSSLFHLSCVSAIRSLNVPPPFSCVCVAHVQVPAPGLRTPHLGGVHYCGAAQHEPESAGHAVGLPGELGASQPTAGQLHLQGPGHAALKGGQRGE